MAFNKRDLLDCRIDCGSGWMFLIDDVLEHAAFDIFFAEEDLKNIQRNTNDPEILREAKDSLDKAIENAPRIKAVIEKGGVLHIFSSKETPELRGTIWMAMKVSKQICEICGNRAALNNLYEKARCRVCYRP
jgi:hypothetical protein